MGILIIYTPDFCVRMGFGFWEACYRDWLRLCGATLPPTQS